MTCPYDKACLCQTELQPSFPSNSHGLHGVLALYMCTPKKL